MVQNGVSAERVQFDGIAHFGNYGAYLEAVLNLGDLRITPGLRVDALHWARHTHLVADPRLWARAQVTASTAVYAYAGLHHQAPEATELDPKFGNPELSPESAQQYGLGAEQKLGPQWTVRVEGFLQRRAALPFAGVARLDSDGTVTAPLVVNSGVARATGFEVLIRREISATFYGWLAYTFSRSRQMQRPGFPWEPTLFDQPHVLTILLGLRPSTQVELAARLRVASGNPVSDVTGAIFDSDTGNYRPDSRPFGEVRLPAFVQLDFQINNIWIADDFRLSMYLDVQNIVGRRNAEVLVYDYRFTRPDSVPGLPLLASVGVKVTW
jgi:outer membrane receptor protein involved in Fe transport